HRLAPSLVDRPRLGRLHLRLILHYQFLMFTSLDRSALCTPGTPSRQRALLTVLLRTTIGRQLQRASFAARACLLADPRQPMTLRALIGLLLGQPDEFALGDLPLRSLRALLLRPVVLLIGCIQVQ